MGLFCKDSGDSLPEEGETSFSGRLLFLKARLQSYLSSLSDTQYRIVLGAAAAFCAFTLLIFAGIFYLHWPVSFKGVGTDKVDIAVARGDTARLIARKVSQSGLEVNETVLEVLLRLQGDDSRIHVGRYRFERGVSIWEIAGQIADGMVAEGKIRIHDGMTFRDLRAIVNASPDLEHTTLNMTDEEILQKIGATEKHPEGLFSPDTYQFRAGVTDLTFYVAAYKKQKAILEREWKNRLPGLKLKTPYEALILASVIEKETGIRTDRHLVSSVFHNRLKIWMPLQTDPTIIYGLGDEFSGRLRKRDLRRPGPYNSYLNYGLPPTPIAMPTAESIQAALHPSSTKYLYFVARGDGTTVFSNTLDSHNRAVTKYQKTKPRAKAKP